jgi:hypothetical protein
MIIQSHWKANWNFSLQTDKPNFNVIAAKMSKKKFRILSDSNIFLISMGSTLAKTINNIKTWTVTFQYKAIYNVPNFNAIVAKMVIESLKNWKNS